MIKQIIIQNYLIAVALIPQQSPFRPLSKHTKMRV